MFDVIIVGAGPAGLSACLEAKKAGLKYLCLEQNKIADTIRNYPKNKKVHEDYMNMKVEKEGDFFFLELGKEELVEKWEEIVKKEKLNVKENDAVIDIKKLNEGFKVVSSSGEYETKNVVLAIGRVSNPRKLCINGEEQDNVFHTMMNYEKYKDKNILVVGGGNNAIESAILLSKNNKVTLSYRKSEFFRLTKENREEIKKSNINFIFESNLIMINDKNVELDIKGEIKNLEFDYIFILIGFNLPKSFLDKIGVEVEDRIDSNINGIYLIGDVRKLRNVVYAINDGKKVIEVIKDGL